MYIVVHIFYQDAWRGPRGPPDLDKLVHSCHIIPWLVLEWIRRIHWTVSHQRSTPTKVTRRDQYREYIREQLWPHAFLIKWRVQSRSEATKFTVNHMALKFLFFGDISSLGIFINLCICISSSLAVTTYLCRPPLGSCQIVESWSSCISWVWFCRTAGTTFSCAVELTPSLCSWW